MYKRKTIDEFRYTGNNKVYKRAKKQHHEDMGDIYCSICKYNRGENQRESWWGKSRSWKDDKRRGKKQYKVKEI